MLRGAKSLAVPVKFGQSLQIERIDEQNVLYWQSKEFGKTWFEAKIKLESFQIEHTSDDTIGSKLLSVLKEARNLNSSFLSDGRAFKCETNLNFNRKWGLGSSSTLLSLIAEWSKCDVYELLKNTFGGSGYDVACAQSAGPLTYQIVNNKAIVNQIDFKPDFRKNICFVFLGKKQQTDQEIKRFNSESIISKFEVEQISNLTNDIINAYSQGDFNESLTKHEKITASVIKRIPIKDERFADFNGEIKSLGAWGGDFIMVSSLMNREETMAYFESKGLSTILSYDDMVL